MLFLKVTFLSIYCPIYAFVHIFLRAGREVLDLALSNFGCQFEILGCRTSMVEYPRDSLLFLLLFISVISLELLVMFAGDRSSSVHCCVRRKFLLWIGVVRVLNIFFARIIRFPIAINRVGNICVIKSRVRLWLHGKCAHAHRLQLFRLVILRQIFHNL